MSKIIKTVDVTSTYYSEPDGESVVELILIDSETREQAEAIFLEEVFIDKPGGPHGCTGKWFTSSVEWASSPCRDVQIAVHYLSVDV